jgi:hypothetical protein
MISRALAMARGLLLPAGVKLAIHLRPGREPDTVQAFCPEVPGCSAHGRSDREALERLRARLAEQLSRPRGALPPGTRVIEIDV